MADALGVVASIVSISQAVSSGVKVIYELYKAPDEIRKLDEQIEVFRCVLQTIEEAPRQAMDKAVTITLFRAQKIVEDLHQLLTVKLSSQSNGSNRARRRAWLKNKRKIVSLRDNLKDARETLSVALNANAIASAGRVESSLFCLGKQVVTGSALYDWHENASCAESTAVAQYSTQHSGMTRFIELDPSSNISSRGTLEPKGGVLTERSSEVELSRRSNKGSVNTRWNKFIRWPCRENKPTQKPPRCTNDHSRISPASSLELSSSFFPESYTTVEGRPKFVSYACYEAYATEYSRVNHYETFCCIAPRQWIRLFLSVTVSIESPHWNAARLTPNRSMLARIPAGLIKTLRAFLVSHPELEQDSHLSVFLGNQAISAKSGKDLDSFMQIGKPRVGIMERLKAITAMTYHWSCPRYFEREMVQQPLYKLFHDNRFIAYLHPRWVVVHRFALDKAQIDSITYMLKAMHCLRGASSINPFVGTLLDQRGIISGFMTELPLQGGLATLLANSTTSGRPVVWERREKWCKQIVQAVATAHAHDFSIGTLPEIFNCSIYIDGWDNAVLWYLQRQFAYDSSRTGVVPPEQRHLASTSGFMDASIQSDIYQLGLALWMIVRNEFYFSRSRFCSMAGCTTMAGVQCTELHADPVQLPSPGQHCPDYIQQIISNCRAENPENRLPAWKLLEMFTSSEKIPLVQTKIETDMCIAEQKTAQGACLNGGLLRENQFACSGKSPTRLEDCEEVIIRCDECGAQTREHFFHCHACVSGDYDICPECFEQGAHCFDEEHYLCELFYNNEGGSVYYSSVKSSGHRDVIKF
ncbi:hypothetical protein F4776DRAFT_499381 [Hypoxylon sp. NC0597]|nr:hypothetical protein F4776DRAFT_499381 [Hypoxylon sp. NC0597]